MTQVDAKALEVGAAPQAVSRIGATQEVELVLRARLKPDSRLLEQAPHALAHPDATPPTADCGISLAHWVSGTVERQALRMPLQVRE